MNFAAWAALALRGRVPQSRRRAAQTVSDETGAHHHSVPARGPDRQPGALGGAAVERRVRPERSSRTTVPARAASRAPRSSSRAAPDGYTLLAGNPGPLTIAPSARAQMPYDTLRDLAPIVLIAKSASCLCAHPSLPVKGVKDFVAFAKARPGAHQLRHAGRRHGRPFRDGAFRDERGREAEPRALQRRRAVHGRSHRGQHRDRDQPVRDRDAAREAGQGALPRRRLRPTRTPLLPDVPTIAEQGLKGFSSYNWNGMLAPAATPKAIIARIHEVIAKALKTPEARDLFVGQGHELERLGPDEYAAFIRAETQKWARGREEGRHTEAVDA